MNPRKFHLFDFPEREIYVMLEHNFREDLFHLAINKFTSERNLADYLGLSSTNFNNIAHARIPYNRSSQRAIPLWLLKKIAEITETDVKEIEKKVIYIKGMVGSRPIYNPKLPLIETYELASIIGNLLGDGYAGKKRNHASYFNREKELVRLFSQKLINVFGNVKVRYAEDGCMVAFPRYIPTILKHLYKISFNTFESRIPKDFYFSKELSSALIRSFADDEAWVDDRRIEFYSANLNLLEDIKKLIELHYPKIKLNNIRTKKANKGGKINYSYALSILSEGLRYFSDEIGLNHPKKIMKLNFALNLQKLNNKRGKTGYIKNQIFRLLNSPMTQEELSKGLNISSSTCSKHLKILLNSNLIKPFGKIHTSAIIWGKNGNGKNK